MRGCTLNNAQNIRRGRFAVLNDCERIRKGLRFNATTKAELRLCVNVLRSNRAA